MNKVKVLVLDVIDNKGFYEAEVDNDNLKTFYDALKCDCFDITTRKIDGRYFDIFCDDVGLFADNPIPSAVDSNLQPVLVGNLIFANHDKEGRTTSLTDEEIRHIKECGLTVVDYDATPLRQWMLVGKVDY